MNRKRKREREKHTSRTSSNSQLHPTHEHLKKESESVSQRARVGGGGNLSPGPTGLQLLLLTPLLPPRLHFQSATPTQVGKQRGWGWFFKTQLQNPRALLPSPARPPGSGRRGAGERRAKPAKINQKDQPDTLHVAARRAEPGSGRPRGPGVGSGGLGVQADCTRAGALRLAGWQDAPRRAHPPRPAPPITTRL